MEKRFQLKQGDKVLATLTASKTGEVTLSHDLTEDQLRMLPTVAPFAEQEVQLKIQDDFSGGKATISFSDNNGAVQLNLGRYDDGILNVLDPKGLAGIRTKLTGPGSVGNHPITDRDLVLELGPFEKINTYRNRVGQLYGQVTTWLTSTSLKIRQPSTTIAENIYGSYHVQLLEISSADGKKVATLEPVGASVIGAEGRVDLVGNRDRQLILYFEAEGPRIDAADTAGSGTYAAHRLFKGVTVAGWYWLEDVRLGRARQLNQELFKDLLKGVADLYEF